MSPPSTVAACRFVASGQEVALAFLRLREEDRTALWSALGEAAQRTLRVLGQAPSWLQRTIEGAPALRLELRGYSVLYRLDPRAQRITVDALERVRPEEHGSSNAFPR